MEAPTLHERLVIEWFSHPEWWFEASPLDDLYLTATFGVLLHELQQQVRIDALQALLDEQPPLATCLATILALDQLPYHESRAKFAQPGRVVTPRRVVASTADKHQLSLACLRVCDYTLAKHEAALTAQQWSFVMLPYRHTRVPQHIFFALQRTWERISVASASEDVSVYKRFLQATYQNLTPAKSPWTRADARSVLAVYESTPEPFDRSAFASVLVESLADVSCPSIHPSPGEMQTHVLKTKMQQVVAEHACGTIIVSLSGGVDSMVCSQLLSIMRNQRSSSVQINLVAVHINYRNKPLCDTDEAMVVAWCRHLGIRCYVRRIDEFHREPAMRFEMRELYERYTRDVRYDTYRTAHFLEMQDGQQAAPPLVVMGHNRDDTLENIVTNILKRQKYDNLLGMRLSEVEGGIRFVRPMLEIPKQAIRQFALARQVPHLCDSTPAWSQRGKIRDYLVPAFHAYNTGLVPALFEHARHVAMQSRVAQSAIDAWVARIESIGTTSPSRSMSATRQTTHRLNTAVVVMATATLILGVLMRSGRQQALPISMCILCWIAAVAAYMMNRRHRTDIDRDTSLIRNPYYTLPTSIVKSVSMAKRAWRIPQLGLVDLANINHEFFWRLFLARVVGRHLSGAALSNLTERVGRVNLSTHCLVQLDSTLRLLVAPLSSSSPADDGARVQLILFETS